MNYKHTISEIIHSSKNGHEATCGQNLSVKDYGKTNKPVTCKNCLKRRK